MEKINIAVTVLGCLGVILVILGYFIKYKGQLNLIAGINSKTIDKVKDKKALANLVGGNSILLGVLFIFGAISIFANENNKLLAETIILIGVLVFISNIFLKTKNLIQK